ncbi:elongation factor P hydroxylase [Thalassomonas sp. M1454]|uniref:elongation factor P hydroxylase n=1 Tax=Thalassomonas sp. M1454 TaxID=2594477 RepID=UPI00117F1AFB|nr:elongation factor P hydroxylase [Thalassomonas sp. M1454]TRX57284.1 elongation factor P hydroxylase [Thalassomonas sp. M1454]
MSHKYQDLIHIFAEQFAESENTLLVKGDDEPIYLPANEQHKQHRIIFAHGFYASALHEISHWCIAGKERRLLEDFGYWYEPDGRDEKRQAQFEAVEIKPQAIEWAFCLASKFKFNVSADNLNGCEVDRYGFQKKVQQQALNYLEQGFPKRAQQFIDALIAFYQPGFVLAADSFNVEDYSAMASTMIDATIRQHRLEEVVNETI